MDIYGRGDVYFSFIYFVVVMCFILPPKEFAAAGLTIQNIFSKYLGSEHVDFVGYHLKRKSITVLIHSTFPLIYYIGLAIVSQDMQLFAISRLSATTTIFALLCLSTFIIGILLFTFWSMLNWKYHPLARDLVKYGTSWRDVASQINLEFRRLEKYSSIMGGTSIYVTDSWIIKCTAYKIHTTQQTDSHLTIVKSEEFDFTHDQNNQGLQYLQIKVSSIPPHETEFFIRLNALEFSDMKDRLNAPLLNARNIVIHQTLNDRFMIAFKEQIQQNGTIEMPSLLDQDSEKCIGCMDKPANIKLLKRCAPLSHGECKQCYCRPMWCLECMGRWFSSRQNQNEPATWMSSLSPCPTCRSKFCMLDIFTVQQ